MWRAKWLRIAFKSQNPTSKDLKCFFSIYFASFILFFFCCCSSLLPIILVSVAMVMSNLVFVGKSTGMIIDNGLPSLLFGYSLYHPPCFFLFPDSLLHMPYWNVPALFEALEWRRIILSQRRYIFHIDKSVSMCRCSVQKKGREGWKRNEYGSVGQKLTRLSGLNPTVPYNHVPLTYL